MTYSTTKTQTWSRTHARYLAGKVAADLRQMQQAYGDPSDLQITRFTEELTELLAARYVETVTYGYRRGDEWVVAMKYSTDAAGQLVVDDRSGRVPRGADIEGATWHSYLTYADGWKALTPEQRKSVKERLPIKRTPGSEPGTKGGWVNDKAYSAAGTQVRRSTVGGA